MDTSKQSDPAIMPGVMQPGRLSQAQTAQIYISGHEPRNGGYYERGNNIEGSRYRAEN